MPDVNLLVYAHRPESPDSEAHRHWLERQISGPQPFALSETVCASFLRIVTNHRVFLDPTPPALALTYCTALLEAPATVAVRPGRRHWEIFADLCTQVGARGNVVPDAYLAALAIEHGATWVTSDRGFARFPGLRWTPPLT